MRELDRERLSAANDELRSFLHRASGDANLMESLTEGDLRAVSSRLSTVPSAVGEAFRSATLNSDLQQEIAEYVHNLRALQTMLEKMHLLTLARKLLAAG